MSATPLCARKIRSITAPDIPPPIPPPNGDRPLMPPPTHDQTAP